MDIERPNLSSEHWTLSPALPAVCRAGTALRLIALLVPLAACSTQPGPGMAQVTENPSSLVDGYLIARGMALSYGHSGRAGPAEITQLVRYDRAALVAVITAQLQPDGRSSRQAEQAVTALVDYTGSNDLRPDPVPPATMVR